MIQLLAFILTLNGMHILYRLSDKQLEKTKKSKWVWLTQHIKLAKLSCFVGFFVAGLLLMAQYGNSIGFISWWIFATPLIFGLILWVNDVRNKPESKRKSRQNT